MSELRKSDSLRSPEWQHWIRQEEWPIAACALLLADVEPRCASGRRIKRAFAISDIAESPDPVRRARGASTDNTDTYISDEEAPFFRRALDIYGNAWAAIRRGKLDKQNQSVAPAEFLEWARGKGYSSPASLERASSRERDEELAKPWRITQLWSVFEAAYLLSSLEPPQLTGSPEALRGDVAVWYRHLKDAITLRQIRIHGQRSEGFGNQLIKPCDVAKWARDYQREIPEWIDATAPALPSRAELNSRIRDLEESLNKQAPVPQPEPEKELEPGERKTLDTLGAYFARRYQYDPTRPRNEATGKVRDELERHGVPLDEKTIRDLMRDGCARFPDDRKKT